MASPKRDLEFASSYFRESSKNFLADAASPRAKNLEPNSAYRRDWLW